MVLDLEKRRLFLSRATLVYVKYATEVELK